MMSLNPYDSLTSEQVLGLVSFLEGHDVSQEVKDIMRRRKEVNEQGLLQVYSQDIAVLFEYEGFDPALTYNRMMQAARGEKQLIEDMVWVAIIFIMRGNNVNKMMNSMSQKGKIKIGELVARYGIVPNLKNQDKRKAITLARMCMTLPCYPMQAMVMLHRRFCPPIDPCMANIHALIRLQIINAYHSRELSQAMVHLLSLACGVIIGSYIGDNDDTLGGLKRYVTAAQRGKKISEESVKRFFKDKYVYVEPLNWNAIGPVLDALLYGKNDRMSLKALAPEVAKVLVEVIPPEEWRPYIQDF